MNITELLKLTTAGYKPAQIRELAELEKDNPGSIQLAATGATLDEVKDLLSLTASADGESPEGAADSPAESVPEPDYKSQYEELKKKADDLEAQLKQIQEKNSTTDAGSSKPADIDAKISDIVASFM